MNPEPDRALTPLASVSFGGNGGLCERGLMGRSGGSPGEELLLTERDVHGSAPGGCTHRERAGPIGFMTVNVDFTFHS